jgi:hypothetical protein
MTETNARAKAQAHIMRALGLLYAPGDVVELRIPKAGRRGTIAGYFDDFELLAQAALKESGRYPGIYVTLNPVDGALLARAHNHTSDWVKEQTTDTNIPRRRNLLIDADATRPGGISSTDAEHDAALARAGEIRAWLTGQGWPAPMYSDSGNGAHLIYRIDLPADDGGLVQRVLKAIAARWTDSIIGIDLAVYNPSRLVKLYATKVCKGDNTPDRPHRWARILKAPEALECVPTALLEALAGDPPESRQNVTRNNTAASVAFDLAEWMRQYAPDAEGPKPWQGGQLWTFKECPWRAGDGQTAFVTQLAGEGIAAGCQHATCPGSKASGNHWRELREMREPGAYDRNTERGDSARAPRQVKTWSYSELLAEAFPEPVWIAPGLIPSGLTLLAGRPKLGKSFLALQLALSLASGGKFLGGDVAQGNALYIALEDSERRLQTRLRDMPRGGIAPGALSFAFHWPALNDLDGLDTLRARVDGDGLRLVVIDTLARAIRGRVDWSDVGQVTGIMGPLQELAIDANACILLVDHHRKTNGFGADVVDDVMGSTGKAAVADTVLGLYRKRGERGATLSVTGRDVEESTLGLTFDPVTLCWQPDGAARPGTVQGSLLAALEDLDGKGTTAELAVALDRPKQNVSRELQELVAKGVVIRGAREGKTIPYILRDYHDDGGYCDDRDDGGRSSGGAPPLNEPGRSSQSSRSSSTSGATFTPWPDGPRRAAVSRGSVQAYLDAGHTRAEAERMAADDAEYAAQADAELDDELDGVTP